MVSQKRHRPEQIIDKLREAEVELAKGVTVAAACRKTRVMEQCYYHQAAQYMESSCLSHCWMRRC